MECYPTAFSEPVFEDGGDKGDLLKGGLCRSSSDTRSPEQHDESQYGSLVVEPGSGHDEESLEALEENYLADYHRGLRRLPTASRSPVPSCPCAVGAPCTIHPSPLGKTADYEKDCEESTGNASPRSRFFFSSPRMPVPPSEDESDTAEDTDIAVDESVRHMMTGRRDSESDTDIDMWELADEETRELMRRGRLNRMGSQTDIAEGSQNEMDIALVPAADSPCYYPSPEQNIRVHGVEPASANFRECSGPSSDEEEDKELSPLTQQIHAEFEEWFARECPRLRLASGAQGLEENSVSEMNKNSVSEMDGKNLARKIETMGKDRMFEEAGALSASLFEEWKQAEKKDSEAVARSLSKRDDLADFFTELSDDPIDSDSGVDGSYPPLRRKGNGKAIKADKNALRKPPRSRTRIAVDGTPMQYIGANFENEDYFLGGTPAHDYDPPQKAKKGKTAMKAMIKNAMKKKPESKGAGKATKPESKGTGKPKKRGGRAGKAKKPQSKGAGKAKSKGSGKIPGN